ncbi:Protein of unknown function, putative [Plasmodium vivax]|uniref:Variable surface protein Vir35 n=1 Tax=Plasmodium vivax TaxID=5855 RepID=A0A1G4EDT1_PLAVI|nr:Protein of unknown function, putative [Plasmodium vivax]
MFSFIIFTIICGLFSMLILFLLIHNFFFQCNAGKNIVMKYKQEGLINKCNNRLLANHETQKDLKYQRFRNNLLDDVNNMNLKYRMNNTSTYDQLNKKKLDAYKKGYKIRYSKKKGLAKLDCYWEKKVFNKIDEIYELSRSMQNDKKKFKKKIYNKFGYRLILFAISPIFGVIFPILFNKNSPFLDYCASECVATANGHSHDPGKFIKSSLSSTEFDIISSFNALFFFALFIIVLTVIIYILVKVVKYERLKEGKGRIKGKGYYRFCKNIFI